MDQPLIHIGLHKTGSTWLQDEIFSSRDFGFSLAPRPLCDRFLGGNSLVVDGERMRELFRPFMDEAAAASTLPVISHEPFSGLPILNGFDSRVIADRLQDAFPNARVLIVIREQRSMMLSVYKHYVKFSGTKPVDYVWHDYTPRDRRYPTPGLEVFEYHRLVEYYMKHFGAENVLVLPYEQLVRDAVDFTGRICRFVGVDAPASVPVSRRNVSPPGLLIAMLRYTNVLIQAFGLAASPWGGPVRHPKIRRARMEAIRKVSGWIPKSVSKPFDRKIADAVNAVPAPGFASSNARTSELIGIDLGALGYEMPAS